MVRGGLVLLSIREDSFILAFLYLPLIFNHNPHVSISLSLSLTDWLIPVYSVVAIVLILVLAIGVASVLLLVACVQTRRLGRKPDTNSINSFPVRLYTYLMHWTV